MQMHLRLVSALLAAVLVAALVTLTPETARAQTGSCTTAGYTTTYTQCSDNRNAASTTVTSSETVLQAITQTAGLVSDRISSFARGGAPSVASLGPSQRLGVIAVGSNGNIATGKTRDADRQSGLAAGNGSPKLGLWVNGGYSSLDFDKSGSAFDGHIWSGAIGTDYRFSDRFIAGLAVGYESGDFDTAFNQGTQESDGFTVSPYAVFLINRAWSLDASFGYASLSYDLTRKDPITLTSITGSTDATRWHGTANVTGHFSRDAWRYGLKAGAVHASEDRDGFTESNGVVQAAKTTDVGLVHVGGLLGYSFGKVEPYLSARGRWFYDDGGSSSDADAVLGLGVYLNLDGITGNLSATTVQGRDDTENYSVYGTIRVEF
jgi:hypothetical protein